MTFACPRVSIAHSLTPEHSRQLRKLSTKLFIFYRKVFLLKTQVVKHSLKKRKLRKSLFYILSKHLRVKRKKSRSLEEGKLGLTVTFQKNKKRKVYICTRPCS